MTHTGLRALHQEWRTLTAQLQALLTDAYGHIDPDMATFVRTYLSALTKDFAETSRSRDEGKDLLFTLHVGELRDLVLDMRRRIEQGKAVLVS